MVENKFQSLKQLIYPGGDMPKPETNKNHLRMYTHNLCPFATRARYAFVAKNIPFQSVECDLDAKAGWHLELNNGFVPVLETKEGDLIYESAVLMQFAHEMAPE